MKYYWSILLFVLVFNFGNSQVIHQVGGAVGYSNYLGDLVEPMFTFKHSSLAGSVSARKQLGPNFSLRGNIVLGKLKGDDRFYDRNRKRGNRFESTFFEMSILAEYDLLGERRYPKNGGIASILSPYVFGGLGFLMLDQSIHYGSADNPDLTAVYNFLHLSIPIGFGLKKDVDKSFQIGIEWGIRFTFSDYIDGVKRSGDASNNDVYFFGGLGVMYQLANYSR